MSASAEVLISTSGADLDVTDGTNYELVRWNPTALEWRRNAITGRYQAGESLINAVPDTQVLGMVVRVMGSTWTAVDTATNALYVALQQFSYTVTATFNSVETTYTECQPATIRPLGGALLAGHVDSGYQDFDIQIRCVPNIGVEA